MLLLGSGLHANCIFFAECPKAILSKYKIRFVYQIIKKNKTLRHFFLTFTYYIVLSENLIITYCVYIFLLYGLTLLVKGERSFSRFKLLKTVLRSSLSQNNLQKFGILWICRISRLGWCYTDFFKQKSRGKKLCADGEDKQVDSCNDYSD